MRIDDDEEDTENVTKRKTGMLRTSVEFWDFNGRSSFQHVRSFELLFQLVAILKVWVWQEFRVDEAILWWGNRAGGPFIPTKLGKLLRNIS